MQKPNGYDETQTANGFTPINLGGHYATIKRVQETTSRNGRPMLQVAIDFDARDDQKNYFMDMFQNDNRQDKKWPFQGTQYILTEDNDGNCSRSFKSFITCVERSNNSECQWGKDFENWFKGKKVGVVYGEVEEEYNDEIKTRRRIRFFCNYDKVATAPIPARETFQPVVKSPSLEADDFIKVPATTEEEIPF